MVDELLARAQAGDGEAFRQLTDPHRRELQVHCYRFLGSVQDAEDLTQETLLAAWRGLDHFEGRSSLRAWLYRIATNRCLNALRDRGRRPQDPPPAAQQPQFTPPTTILPDEPSWLEPLPDLFLEDSAPGPEALWESKESISLAFVVAMQHLPPRQRAVLLLRDVLGFRAAEVADMLDTTEDSVNGALKRARSALASRQLDHHSNGGRLPRPGHDRRVAERFAEALQRGDTDAIISLLTDDALLTMPPEPYAWQGSDAVARFLVERFTEHSHRIIHTTANGQPAFGLYLLDTHSPVARALGLVVLTLADDRISAITRFSDTGVLSRFGLPRTLQV